MYNENETIYQDNILLRYDCPIDSTQNTFLLIWGIFTISSDQYVIEFWNFDQIYILRWGIKPLYLIMSVLIGWVLTKSIIAHEKCHSNFTILLFWRTYNSYDFSLFSRSVQRCIVYWRHLAQFIAFTCLTIRKV